VTAAVVCLEEGMTPENLEAGLLNLAPVAMRMDLKAGINECQLIEDYYNSDPGSLRMALDFMRSGYQRKLTLILSDFIQSGRDEAGLFTEVSELIKKTGINRLIGIGDVISRNRDLFPPGSIFFRNTEDFISSFSEEQFRGEIILLKGARKFEFEKISRLLSQKVHQTFLEVNLDAITHNLNEFRKKLKPGTRILAMVKAFAYGAGAVEISSLLAWHRVDYLSVAIADEGVELRNAGIALPIIVMNPVPDAFSLMIKYNLEPEIYSLTLLKKFSKVAASHGLADYPVHIKIDTGMHRLGLFPAETDQLLTELSKSDNLKVSSVFSHLSASEDPEKDNFTHKQARTLLEVSEKIKKGLGYSFLLHLLNTSGIVRFPEYQFDMVRPGIGLYGAAAPGGIDLKAAGRYCTTISQVKTVAAGEPVGYGCLDISETERQIAILPVGYADGLDRRMGMGAGKLFIRNQYVKIIGNICMDMCMADVTGLNAVEGDEAEIFGNNIKVEEVAAVCGTIPYEILTSIPERVRRVFYRE
jgi:alanine racemase